MWRLSGCGQGEESLAEMQKHPEAGKAAAGRGPSLTELSDPKAQARGRGRGAPPEARAGFWGKERSREQICRDAGAHPPDPSLA